jgi:glycosyltransferase involved in cell wall biosynthesis
MSGGRRVLAVGSMYPPHHLGGYELAWQSAIAHLRSRGHEVRVLASDFRTDAAAADEPGTFRELRWYWRDHAWPKAGWRERVALERHNAAVLERHLSEHRPDVVTWWAMGGMSLALIERVRRAGLPAVAFVHDDWMTYGPSVDQWLRPFRHRPRLAALAEQITGLPARVPIDDAARCVFVSENARAHARGAGYALPGSEVAHSGIDPSYLDARPEREWGWRLLYVGRLDERKGVLDAVTALATLPPEATLTIAGAGDRVVEQRLRERARKLGIEHRVRALGMRSREALPDVYAAADVVVFPVRWEEPWGLVPLEAMALGRPVIATGRGGSGEYLQDEENCLIVSPADPAAIARAVGRLAADPTLRARLRAGGSETARRHTEHGFNAAVGDAVERAAEAPRAENQTQPSIDVSAHHAP